MRASKITTLGVIFFCLLTTSVTLRADTAGWLDEKVNIRFQNEAMSKVLGKISQQTGVAILFDEKLASEKVTGYYKNIKFSEVINRLFSEKNKSIQAFKYERKIIIKTFGAKQFILAGQDSASDSSGSAQESYKMTLAELEKMHKQQYKEYKERITDGNELIDGGMTRDDIQTLHRKQYEEYKKRTANEDEIIDGGMTRGDIRALHKKQYEEYKKRTAHEDEIIDGDMTRGQIRELHKQQAKAFLERKKNTNEVIDGKMTRGQIQALHVKQSQDIEARRDDKSQPID